MLFLVAWGIVAIFTRTAATSAHEWSRLGTIDSLVERWSYDLETSGFHGTSDKILFHGHYYSHQPPLLSTLESPVYWLLRRVGLQFWNSARFDLAYYLFTLLTNGVAFALTVVLFDRVLSRADVTTTWRTVLALVLPFGTWLLPYALVTNNHGISALLLMATAALLLSMESRGVTVRGAARLGASLGLMTAIEIVPLLTFVPIVCVYLASRAAWRVPRMARAFAVGLLTPLVAHAILNVPLTGDLRPGGFHAELFDYPGSRFTPETLTGQLNHGSLAELADYSWRALVSEKGYFTVAPVLLAGLVVGVFEWRWWKRARAAHVMLLGGSLASLIVALTTTNNFGGAAVGFRHAVFICPAWLTLLLPVLGDRTRRARIATTLVGVAAGASMIGLFLLTVPRPWFQLTYPPPPISTSWRTFVPVIGHAVDRWNGTVDEFGNPSTQSSSESGTTSLRAGPR